MNDIDPAVIAHIRLTERRQCAALARSRAEFHRDHCHASCRCADGWHIADAIERLAKGEGNIMATCNHCGSPAAHLSDRAAEHGAEAYCSAECATGMPPPEAWEWAREHSANQDPGLVRALAEAYLAGMRAAREE